MTVKTDPARDALFDELGLMRLRESYMKAGEESPQERFRFVAEQFGSNPAHAQRIYDYLVSQGIIVRNRNRVTMCGNCLRITIGSKTENSELLAALRAL